MPQSLALSVDLQARDAFFTYLVPGISKYWKFLKLYRRATETPDHLTLAIEAVSSAYLWHQVYSDALLIVARKRYISALHLTNQILDSPHESDKDTTLVVALLLDLFEKITDSGPQKAQSWVCHIHGGLALVRYCILEQFQDPLSIQILVTLASNYIISCIVSGSPVPDEVIAVRKFIGKYVDVQDPYWQITDTMADYANLRTEIEKGSLQVDDCIQAAMELELRLQAMDRDMPPSWQYSTTLLEHKSDRVFDRCFDSYPSRSVCQGWNGLRLLRILLNQCLLEHYLISPMGNQSSASIEMARGNIKTLARKICASLPPYVDCGGAALQRLSMSKESNPFDQAGSQTLNLGPSRSGHPHSPNHLLDCYTLIFPLYVAGISNADPRMRLWIIKKLRYMSSHFSIRGAEVVAQILERATDVDPWRVYSMLGSYAFAA